MVGFVFRNSSMRLADASVVRISTYFWLMLLMGPYTLRIANKNVSSDPHERRPLITWLPPYRITDAMSRPDRDSFNTAVSFCTRT